MEWKDYLPIFGVLVPALFGWFYWRDGKGDRKKADGQTMTTDFQKMVLQRLTEVETRNKELEKQIDDTQSKYNDLLIDNEKKSMAKDVRIRELEKEVEKLKEILQRNNINLQN